MNSSIETPNAAVEVAEASPVVAPAVSPVLAGAALAGAAVLAKGMSYAQAQNRVFTFNDIPGTGDVKVLNYALTLEDLETELYVQAVQRLTGGGSGGRDAAPNTQIQGLGLSENARDVATLTQFTRVEREHRDFLRNALGNAARPPLKFNFNINALNRQQVIALVLTAEKTGVTAYLGAIPFFQTKTFLPVAAAILGTEARHTAIVADISNDQFGTPTTVAPLFNQNNGRDPSQQPNAVLRAVSGFIVS